MSLDNENRILSLDFTKNANFDEKKKLSDKIFALSDEEVSKLEGLNRRAEVILNVRFANEIVKTRPERLQETINEIVIERNKPGQQFTPSGSSSGKGPISQQEYEEIKRQAEARVAESDRLREEQIVREVIEQRNLMYERQLKGGKDQSSERDIMKEREADRDGDRSEGRELSQDNGRDEGRGE